VSHSISGLCSTKQSVTLVTPVDLGSIAVTEGELEFLRRKCPYFPEGYLQYLKNFRLKPNQEVKLEFHPVPSPKEGDDEEEDDEVGTRHKAWEEVTKRLPLGGPHHHYYWVLGRHNTLRDTTSRAGF